MKKSIKARLLNNKGSAYTVAIVGFLVIMMVIAIFMKYAPVYTMKFNLDNYATELIREAEVTGYVGDSTTGARLVRLNQIKGIEPNVSWSKTGYINIGEEVTVIVSKTVTIDFFGAPVSYDISASASGKSEVYRK